MTPTPEQSPSWIAFLDLLGTKDSSKIKKSDYPERIDTFSRTIREQGFGLQANVKIRFFSDSAYVECQDIVALATLAKRVRNILFSEGIFFKSAISRGALDDIPCSITQTKEDGYTIDVQGASFGEKAVGVYYNQENFKGIGFYIDHPPNENADQLVCQSAFPLGDDLKSWREFYDVSYHKTQLDSLVLDNDDLERNEDAISFLDIVLENALKANYQRRGLSRYYISNFISIVNSSDFSRITLDDDEWKSFPPAFYHLVMSRRRRSNYSSLKGGIAIYFALLNKFFSVVEASKNRARFLDADSVGICDRLVQDISDVRISSSLEMKFPSAVLSAEVREYLIHRIVTLRMQ